MIRTRLSRRAVLAGISTFAAAGGLRAETVVDLDWKDLLPPDDRSMPSTLLGILPHDETAAAVDQPMSSGTRTDWNGQVVRMSGFVVPVDQNAEGVSAFILVPYVGACVHVPPPPANQLVFVSTAVPYDLKGMFEAVTVTGMFGTAATSTQLADIGYALSADDIRPYAN